MKRKQHHFLIFLLLLLFMFLPVIVWSELSPPAQHQNMTWKGSISKQKAEFIKVVETQKEWSDLWRRVFDQPAPDMDFENMPWPAFSSAIPRTGSILLGLVNPSCAIISWLYRLV